MTWGIGKATQNTRTASTAIKGVYAWAVVEGPVSAAEMCGCGEDDCGFLNDPTHMIVVRCNVEGSEDMFDEEFFFESFNATYNFKRDIQVSKEPMLIGETYE